jgi:hypothetical protein
MKIRLIRTGGFIPVTKAAETEADLSYKELVSLLEVIRADPSAPRIKDGNSYELRVGNNSTSIDLDKVPEKYCSLFTKLKSEMKIIKEG